MSRFAMCPDCGHRLSRFKDSFGYWDGETYICNYCSDENENNEYDEESLSVFEAADIWFSNGKDEEYMFGFSEDELEEGL
ncbi:TPA: hypothetical protein ACGO9H_000868 [Streptococcus suis]